MKVIILRQWSHFLVFCTDFVIKAQLLVQPFKNIPMKKAIVALFAFTVVSFTSCESNTDSETNTERFYASPWEVSLHRTHLAVGSTPAADESFTGNATLEKSGSLFYDMGSLNDHMYQSWSYSWSTDHFFMNWEPCIDWHMNETSDSLFLHYNHYDFDPNSGNSFYWDYEVIMTK